MDIVWRALPTLSYVYNVEYRAVPDEERVLALARVLRETAVVTSAWPLDFAIARSKDVLDSLSEWQLWDVPIVRQDYASPSVRACCVQIMPR